MNLTYDEYYNKVMEDTINGKETIDRKIYELLKCYVYTDIVPTCEYMKYITMGIVNRYYMYKDVYPKISTSEDSFTSYAIKDNNGYYNLEDFLLNRLFNNLKKIYINHDKNAKISCYQSRNKAIYFAQEAFSKYITETLNQDKDKYLNMIIASIFDHELGHALKAKCFNGISVYHDNRNILYEKLIDILEKSEAELLNDIPLERIKSDNEIYVNILHDLRTIYNNKYQDIIKSDAEINFDIGFNQLSLQKYKYLDELFQEIESRYYTNSFEEPNYKRLIGNNGNYINITRPFSSYSAIFNYGDILLALIGLKDFFQVTYLDSNKVLKKFNNEYRTISKYIFRNSLSAINNVNTTLEKIVNKKREKDYLKLDLFLTKCYEQKIDKILKEKINIDEINKLLIDTNTIMLKLTLNKANNLAHIIILKNIMEKLKFKKRLLLK